MKAPDYGPATPSGGSRISFGFTSSPISPVRHPASPTSPAAPAAPAPEPVEPLSPTGLGAPDLPVRRASTHTGEQRRASTHTGETHTGEQRRVPTPTGEQRRVPTPTGEQRRMPTPTGEQRRVSTHTGEQRRLSDTGGFARADSSEFRRVMDARALDAHTLDPRPADLRASEGRGADTGELRRFLEASDRPAEPGEQRVAVAVPPPPRQSRAVTVGIVLLSLVVLVAGGIVGVAYFTGTDDKLDSVLQLGAGNKSGDRTVTAPLDNRNQASFELLAATNRVNVSIGELGDDLYRISTPDDSGILPDPVINADDVKLQVTKDGDGGTSGEITIVLAAKVRWALRFSGYAEEQAINLSGGQISGLEMVGGMRTAQISLARPTGTVPIKVNGAVEKLVVASPTGSPVRIKVGGGAQTVVAGSRTIKDVAPGSTLTPKNWAVQNRYDIGAGAPITTLTVENS
ncbi:hypothetical protein [Paractinoplanes lichenicola]|uniref:Uncharacterized protein n=1 Tax=Paractinoplanes lichenicola TaxID=2802976 RepID=A0ABS1W0Y2_9ACTN|nr:hypothetical protein [Actinoplanes lichenicola]MBL7260393.1 hypothetical protein [Actinoplanes lichenicola]